MSNSLGEKIKSGYVMILGLPNVGKSTLLNCLLKEKLAAVTPKPQTTRNRILGIAQGDDHQVLFLDTPGVCVGDNELNKFLVSEIDRAFADADLVLFMTEAHRQLNETEHQILERLKGFSGPKFLVINKVDAVRKTALLPKMESLSKLDDFKEIFPISATENINCDELFQALLKYLPMGPRYYPKEHISDISERFLAAEIVREKVFLQTHQEVPYSTAVVVNAFEESDRLIRIQADIIIERDTQKGIIIGKKGQMLKSIGTEARLELEKVFAKKIHLELFVKVVPNWSKNRHRLKELGYG